MRVFVQKARKVCAVLMLVSGVTHNVQLFVYGTGPVVIGSAIFGAAYFLIGLLLLGKTRLALALGTILPAVGGALGVYRFVHLQTNPFSVFHVLIDLVVVPCCLYLWLRSERSQA
jgi:hypothetical protein